MTEDVLKTIEGLAGKASEGPLTIFTTEDHGHIEVGVKCDDDDRPGYIIKGGSLLMDDAKFFAASREAVPELCAALRKSWAERDQSQHVQCPACATIFDLKP